MSLVDLGMKWEDAEKETTFPVLDLNFNPYSFRVKEMFRNDLDGSLFHRNKDNTRDMWVFVVEVFGCQNDEFNGVTFRYYCPLPYTDETGKTITKGIGLLASLVKGVGAVWEGTSFDPESILGREFKGVVKNEEFNGSIRSGIGKVLC